MVQKTCITTHGRFGIHASKASLLISGICWIGLIHPGTQGKSKTGFTKQFRAWLFAEYQAAGVQMLICSIYQNDVETLELLSELKDQFKN